MGTQVKMDGQVIEVQEAFDALSTKVKTLQETLDETMTQAGNFNRTDANPNLMDMTLGNIPSSTLSSRPYFDLVPSIPSYNGDQADLVNPFFEQIDGVSELSGWTDSQKLQVIKLKLSGNALRFAKSDERCKAAITTAEFRAAIVDRFGDSLPSHYYFEQLANARQMKGETIETFADRVKRISDKATRTTANHEVNRVLKEEADRRSMEAFVRGLYGEVGRQTRIKFPKSFREAVSLAIALNNIEKSPSREDTRLKRVFNVSAERNCYSCGKQGHLSRDCRFNKRQPDICAYCKRTGHREVDCRIKANSTRPYCSRCRRPGHMEDKCWSNTGRGAYSPRGRGSARGFPRGRGFSSQGHNDRSLNTDGNPRSAAGYPENS